MATTVVTAATRAPCRRRQNRGDQARLGEHCERGEQHERRQHLQELEQEGW